MKRLAIAIVAVTTILTACNNKQRATISGQFFGAADKNIVLEEYTPTGGRFVDSTRTNSDGKFIFKIDFKDKDYPMFYNVRLGSQFAPLLVERGEEIELSAIGNIYNNYIVKGSKGSELLSEFNRQTVRQSMKLDSINQLYNTSNSMERSEELGREYGREYVKLKQAAITFVMRNASSLAAVVPLYQSTYNGVGLFGEPSDIIYLRAIADSLEKSYPESPYVNSLRNDIKRVDNVYAMDSMIMAGLNSVIDFPEITMNDAAGKSKSLTSLKGKVILLSFTSSSEPKLKILNRELLGIYEKYNPKGFEIFQVYIESNKAAWLKSITETRLPWIQVSDIRGTTSPSLAAYNIQKLPAYFLIDSSGKITQVNLKHADIEPTVEKLFK